MSLASQIEEMSVFSIGRLFIWLFIVSPSGESGGENTKYLIEGYEMKFYKHHKTRVEGVYLCLQFFWFVVVPLSPPPYSWFLR